MDVRKCLWSICARLGLVLAVSNCEWIAVAEPLDSFKAELARERLSNPRGMSNRLPL